MKIQEEKLTMLTLVENVVLLSGKEKIMELFFIEMNTLQVEWEKCTIKK